MGGNTFIDGGGVDDGGKLVWKTIKNFFIYNIETYLRLMV